MKKIFTLAAMVCMAMSVNAQEIWDASSIKDLSVDGKYNVVDETKISKEENTAPGVIVHDEADVLPYPGDGNETDVTTITNTSTKKLQNVMIKGETENVSMKFTITPNIGDDEGAFSYGLGVNPDNANNNKSLSTDKCSPKFLDYIKPKSGNAVTKHVEWWEYNANGDVTHKYKDEYWTLDEKTAPGISANISFTSKCNGLIKVGIFVNKNIQNNAVYVLDVNEDQTYTPVDPNGLYYEGYINNNTTNSDNQDTWFTGYAKENYVLPTDQTNPFLGYLSFELKANKTYQIFIAKSQIGLYGFEFTPNKTLGINGITTVNDDNADAPVYNLAGQRVGKDAKGILIQNGKKFVRK